MSEPRILRCGRLPEHDAHTWTTPPSALKVGHTYSCTGHVLTTLAEREWADRADFDDKRDDERREWLREGWSA